MIEIVVILGLVVYRVTRFFLKDSMIEEPRTWFYGKLVGDMEKQSWWRDKLYELLDCPYCFSVWVSAGGTIVMMQFRSVPLPVYVWLCGSTVALVIWHFLEPE
jgi:hypothetical protein